MVIDKINIFFKYNTYISLPTLMCIFIARLVRASPKYEASSKVVVDKFGAYHWVNEKKQFIDYRVNLIG